eukprot:RCo030604
MEEFSVRSGVRGHDVHESPSLPAVPLSLLRYAEEFMEALIPLCSLDVSGIAPLISLMLASKTQAKKSPVPTARNPSTTKDGHAELLTLDCETLILLEKAGLSVILSELVRALSQSQKGHIFFAQPEDSEELLQWVANYFQAKIKKSPGLNLCQVLSEGRAEQIEGDGCDRHTPQAAHLGECPSSDSHELRKPSPDEGSKPEAGRDLRLPNSPGIADPPGAFQTLFHQILTSASCTVSWLGSPARTFA